MEKPKATPTIKRRLSASFFSTPLSHGTASRAEFSKDYLAKSARNIELVEEDLRSKRVVHILHFLKALLGRMLLERNGNILGHDCSHRESIIKERNLIFAEMLNDAVTFCNGKTGENWKKLKNHLVDYCKQSSEGGRYLPLSQSLNVILSEFKDKTYGPLPNPDTGDDSDYLIFMPNDPEIIDSIYLWGTAKRKPDVVGVHLSLLREMYVELKESSYDTIAKRISKEARKAMTTVRKPTWADILQTWELKATGSLDFNDRKWSIKKILDSAKVRSVVTGEKRTQDDRDSEANSERVTKRSRAKMSATQDVHVDILPDGTLSEDPRLSPDVQCAFYAIARLSSSWPTMHSFVILLSDASLSLRWYDAQGCIESEPFNVLEHLPILVLMSIIFQRFNSYMWGVSQNDVTSVEVEGQRFYLHRVTSKFQLKGRRTVGTFAEPEPDIHLEAQDGNVDRKWPPHLDDMNYFFKNTWTECSRDKEYDIITEAYELCDKLLPTKYRTMVSNHIPEVIASQACVAESTAVIRFFMDEAEGSIDAGGDVNEKHARIRIWMVSARLQAIPDLDPSRFWKVYWDILGCHYLLWKVGIAHGDISLTNMMCTLKKGELLGVLNDFDLATRMEPESRSPGRKGFERTGSLPFMAIDHLTYPNGVLGRLYRHDLESFLWCLVWEVLADRPSSWVHNCIADVSQEKSQFLKNIFSHLQGFRLDWRIANLFILDWTDELSSYTQSLSQKVARHLQSKGDFDPFSKTALTFRNAEEDKTRNSDHIRKVAKSAKQVKVDLEIPVLVDISWIDVILETSK